MNKKGLTIVELLAVLVIIGLLAVVIFPVINSNIHDSNEKTRKIQEKSIIEAAKQYHADYIGTPSLGNQENININLYVLIEEGYLSGNYKNPINGKDYDLMNSKIIVTKIDNSYDYTLELVEK